MRDLDFAALLVRWRNHVGGEPPTHLPKFLIIRMLAFRLQENAYGSLPDSVIKALERLIEPGAEAVPPVSVSASLRPGTLLTREWKGELHRVTVLEGGFAWNGGTLKSLSEVARAITGTRWSGPKFFGLEAAKTGPSSGVADLSPGPRSKREGRRRARKTVPLPMVNNGPTAHAQAEGDPS